MKYMGSKNRLAKHILPIMLAHRESDHQCYVEPFVGGFNLIDKVFGCRIAADTNPYLIELFTAIKNGWIPPDSVSNDEYQNIKSSPDNYPPELVGFVGIGCSYSGKWFGGYARGNTNKGEPRNYCLESKNNILKQAPSLVGVDMRCCDYAKLDIPPSSIVYCDPPYRGTTEYTQNTGFDSSEFWSWCRSLTRAGHVVFISEFSAPDDFTSIWGKERVTSLTKETGSKSSVERLFKMAA